ncbi:MAG: WG repeat-containing protein [Solobacterium sp.]|nr:WG repeat-containing protein [Solobacterium sp.]
MMQYPEIFSQIYQLRIRVLLETGIADAALKQQVMTVIFERGKQLYDISPALVTEKALTELAREEIQKLVRVPAGVGTDVLMQDMTEEEQKTTVLLYQENRNTEEIAEILQISKERAEEVITSVKNRIEEKLKDTDLPDGLTATGLMIGMLKAYPASSVQAAAPAAIVTPGISASAPAVITAGGNSAASSASSSAAVSSSVSQAAAVSSGRAAGSSAVYTAANAGPAAAGTSAAKAVTAGTAVKTAAAAGGATAAKVAVTAAVAVTVVGGGGYAGYKYYESKTNEPAPEVTTEPEKEEEINTPEPTEVVIEETEEPAPEAVWIKEPQFEFDTVEPLVSWLFDSADYYVKDGRDGVSGYPQEWVKYERLTMQDTIPEYTANAAEFITGDTGGIVSYDGEILYSGLTNTDVDYYNRYDKVECVVWQPFTGYMNDWKIALNPEFTGPAERGVGGVGDPVTPFWAVYRNGSMYNYTDAEEYRNDPDNRSEIGPYHSDRNEGIMIRVYDDNWNDLGYGYVTNEHGPVMVPEGDIVTPLVVNGFYGISKNRKEEYIQWNTRFDTMAWVNAETGERITDHIYEDTWFFEDGYCPVKKDGYWGFINEEGQEVSDFVFEDASTLYDGRAFVKVNGKFGILDIAETIGRYGYISSEMIRTNAAGPEETAQDTADSYDAVLQAYRNCLAAKGSGSAYEDPDSYANSMLVEMYDDIKYALYDIDGNGIEELIVAGESSGYTDIGGVYTMHDGKITVLENYTVYRDGMTILSNGIFKETGSGGWAWTSYTYYRIDPENGVLVQIDAFESDYEKYPDTPWLHDGERLTDEEMQELTQPYEAEEISPDYRPL